MGRLFNFTEKEISDRLMHAKVTCPCLFLVSVVLVITR